MGFETQQCDCKTWHFKQEIFFVIDVRQLKMQILVFQAPAIMTSYKTAAES